MLARCTHFLFLLSTLYLIGCSNEANFVSTSTSASIIPFQTPTASSTVTSVLEGVTPSPTPYIYTVALNDTFFSIAARLNIDLNELLAANPDVDPRSLLPGTKLLVPMAGQTAPATTLPTLTPVAAAVSMPICYSTATAEVWCFLLITNNSQQKMENLTGEIQLIGANGKVMAASQAVPPLDVLIAGGRMPLVAYFQSPPKGWVSPVGRLLTGFWLPQGDEHYLNSTVTNLNPQIEDGGQLSVRVQGSIQLEPNKIAQTLWVLAIAYDAKGDVVGYRRWESAGDLDFDFWVYSLGPKIRNVEVLLEALP